MKKIFVLSMLASVAMMCACQKKDSSAEQQLAQPKTELGVREEALAERLNSLEEKVNSLDQRVKELAEKENTAANARTNPTGVQGQTSDPAQVRAEKERMIQQLSTMIPDASRVTAGDPAKQERPAARQLGPEDLQRQWQANLDKAKMSGKAVFPAAEAASPTPSPAVEATSPSPSPTPQ
jgi:chromosome segregation ATPase